MKLSNAQTAVVLLAGLAQPALGEIQVGHRVAHMHYGKHSIHSHGDAAVLKEREAQASQQQTHQHEKRHTPAIFLRDSELTSPREVEARDHAAAAAVAADETSHNATKRGTTCTLPTDPDIYAVPGQMNGGWAISPDVQCTADSWCPYACVPGKVMAQWKPGTSYVTGESTLGGLYCGSDGTPVKSFTDQPYCVDGTGTITAVNQCGSVVSFCQTVLPGNEAMLIPTDVTGSSVLAVPGPTYWDGTAAHYYINPPGVDGVEGCVWGADDKPIGNWSPYVGGGNTVSNGDTYVKIGWNPIFQGCALGDTKPTFGVRIECPDGNCNGLPCEITAEDAKTFDMTGDNVAVGAGDAKYCVVTAPKGSTANIVVYNFDDASDGTSSGSGSGDDSSSSSSSSSSRGSDSRDSSTSSSASPSPTPSSSSSTSTTSTSSSILTSSSASPTSSSAFSSSSPASSSSETSASESSSPEAESSSSSSSRKTKTSTTKKAHATTFAGAIFQEDGTNGTVVTSRMSKTSTTKSAVPTTTLDTTATSTKESPSASTSSKSEAIKHSHGGAAVAGLVVAVVAGLWLY
ncbi:MAG: hypothetical protein STHCBS139747_007853 [Sporothrix thermara]